MNAITIKTPLDVLAAVPHVLGFHPEDSFVGLSMGGPTARLDMPHTEENLDAALLGLTGAIPQWGGGVIVVGYTDDTERLHRLTELVVVAGAKVMLLVQVDDDRYRINHDSVWQPLPDLSNSAVNVAFVAKGSAPEPYREALTLPTEPCPVLASLLNEPRTFTPEEAEAELHWIAERGVETRFTDEELARFVLACDAIGAPMRDAALSSIPFGDKAHQHHWHDAATRTGARSTGVLAVYGWAAYMLGLGARAWMAVDLIVETGGRDEVFADLLAIALQEAVNPAKMPAFTLEDALQELHEGMS